MPLLLIIPLLLAVLASSPAQAHVSEQAFVLLLPTQAYIIGGCLSVLASILIVALAPKSTLDRVFTPVRFALPALPTRAANAISLLSAVVMIALVAIGITGPRDPLTNLLPLMIWIGVWIVLFNFVGVFGNIWHLINPWTGVHRLIFGQSEPAPLLPLPKCLGVAPAIVGFCLMFGFTIVDIAPADPDRLAWFVLFYWVFHLAAMAVFGATDWLARGEPLTLFFAQISRVAAIRGENGCAVGVPGWQLNRGHPALWGPAVFALLILGLGSFDGLKETFWWLGMIGINPLEFPGRSAVVGSSVIGMILSALVLLAVFALTAWAGKALGNAGHAEDDLVSFKTMFCVFAPTVLPIALVFHASHFTVTLLVDGQYLLAAFGDPLARGANFLGLGDIRVTTGFLRDIDTVRTIWLTQAGLVVAGHILAVVIAHSRALEVFKTARNAAISQIPMGLFMVLYTLFGLWLLAAPRGM